MTHSYLGLSSTKYEVMFLGIIGIFSVAPVKLHARGLYGEVQLGIL